MNYVDAKEWFGTVGKLTEDLSGNVMLEFKNSRNRSPFIIL